jgi:peptidoglycan hydrolase CwlO-like protein
MGFGSTAKKIQKLADMAEQLYERLQEVRAEVDATRETVEETNERMSDLEAEVAAQRALLEELAAAQGVDVAAVREGVDSDPDAVDTDAEA